MGTELLEMPPRSRKNVSFDQNIDSLPDLNAGALQSLTTKIQNNLNGSNKAQFRPAIAKAKKGKAVQKENNVAEASINDSKTTLGEKARRSTKTLQSQLAGRSKPEQPQGKKRFLGGQVKENGKGEGKTNKSKRSDANAVKLGSAPSRKRLVDDDAGLEGEMLALGGTKEDLELIGESQSESELDGDERMNIKGRDVGLNDELLHMVQGLGIQKAERRAPEDEIRSGKNVDKDDDGHLAKRKIGQKIAKKNSRTASDVIQAHARPDKEGVQFVVDDVKSRTKGRARLIFEPLSEWHSMDLPLVPQPKQEPRAMPQDLSDRVHEHARALLEEENSQYAAHHGSASTEHKFYSTLMATGTLSDKISALTLSVQESPLHNMKSLESLVGLAGKRSRDQAVNVLGTLKDLFGPGNLLPSDRRLRSFASQPALAAAFGSGTFHSWSSSSPLPKSLQDIHLVSFAYEDWLKTKFFEVLKILERWCNDEVAYARGKAVDYVSSLLKDKPEQEANLLRLLVNKLGDSDKKIASKTSFNILQLETAHPVMKSTIIAAIESDILFKPNQSLPAQYYAVITLNQTVLSTKEERVARQLLGIYFSLFTKLLKRPDPERKNVNVPTPIVDKISINRKGDIQGGGGAAGKKALKKQKAAEKSTAVHDDLQEKMLSAILTGVNRAIPYTTTNDDSFDAHMDTLYRVTHSSNFNTGIQALMLIQQMNGVNEGSQDRFYRVLYESLLDPRLLTSSKQALYLNLIYRALRSDSRVNRVKAFVKRLLQVIAMHQPPFVCGVLYLVRELEGVFPSLAMLIDEPEEDASDDEETFHDIDDASNMPPEVPSAVKESATKHARYDPRKRDPVHADAALAPLWELPTLLQHYHPSISLFAARLMEHDPMPPKPDLQQNTLISFLDRFVYKNAKAGSIAKAKGASIMQPLNGGEDGSVLLSAYSGAASRTLPVNSDAFWRQKGENVGPDEVFFHKYFSTIKSKEARKREKREKKAKKVRKVGDGEGSDDDEEEEEAAIWEALVESRPEIEGDESDVDMGFSDDEDFAAAIDDDASEWSSLEENDNVVIEDGESSVDMEGDDSEVDAGGDDGPLSDSAELFDGKGTSKAMAVGSSEKGEDRKAKRRRLKGMPTFASAEDYANMLADESDEDGR